MEIEQQGIILQLEKIQMYEAELRSSVNEEEKVLLKSIIETCEQALIQKRIRLGVVSASEAGACKTYEQSGWLSGTLSGLKCQFSLFGSRWFSTGTCTGSEEISVETNTALANDPLLPTSASGSLLRRRA